MNMLKQPTRTILAAIGIVAIAISSASAQNGTWNQTGTANPYNWSDTGNWAGGTVAGGTDATASFTVNPTGAQTVDLDTAVTLGNLTLNRNQNLNIAGPETLTMAVTTGIPTIDVSSGRTLDIFSVIAGTNGLQKDGAGTVRLRGTSTITGGVTVTGGTLQAFEIVANTIGNGAISLSGGGHLMLRGNNTSTGQFSVGTGGGAIQNRGNNAFTTTGILTGPGTLTFSDAGGAGGRTFNFNSISNDFTGGFVVSNANAHVIQVNSLVDSASNIAFNRASGSGTATFRYGTGAVAALTLNNRAFELNGGSGLTGIIENLNTTHAITVNTNLVATGAGAKTLSLRGSAGPTNVFAGIIPDETDGGTGSVTLTKLGASTWILSGDNTFTGTTTISAGRLEIGGSGSLGNVSAGVGNYAGDISIASSNSGRLVYNSTAAQTLGGEISGAGALFVEDGTLILTGDSTYTGATNVNGGTLLVNGSTGTSTVTVAPGATLGGSGTVGGATTVGGFLNPGSSPGVLTFEAGLTLQSTTLTTMEIAGITRDTEYDGIDITGGQLTYAGDLELELQTLFGFGSYTFNLFDVISPAASIGDFESITLTGLYSGSFVDDGMGVWSASTNGGNELWSFDHSTGDLNLVAIPEPSALLLGALGLLALLRRRRCRAEFA